jgi:hypothetical protein
MVVILGHYKRRNVLGWEIKYQDFKNDFAA